MPILQTWREYEDDGTDHFQFVNINTGDYDLGPSDIYELNFGPIARGTESTKYIGLRFLGCPVEDVHLILKGVYADVISSDTSAYGVDIVAAPYSVGIWMKQVGIPSDMDDVTIDNKLTGEPIDILISSEIISSYKDEGFSLILGIKIAIPIDSNNYVDCEYQNFGLYLEYTTIEELMEEIG
jgi:hypothetical protein